MNNDERTARQAQDRADQLAKRADTMSEHADGMYGRFAGGQPLLVGHHSYRSALRDRERADNATRRAIEARQEAKHAQQKAARARDVADAAATVAARVRPWQRSDFRPGDIVTILWHGASHMRYRVLRANAKTLTLDGGGGFDNTKKPYDRILSRTRDGVTITSPEDTP